jgi:2-polyprenyl-3-methyl-5-hydroxy-6-metoxy-1,4-benzoquinol methylase
MAAPHSIANAEEQPAPTHTGFAISPAQLQQIARVPHFAGGAYAKLPIAGTLEFYKKRYVDQLSKFRTVDAGTVIADIGAGYGWLAMAFAAYTPARVIAIEMDAERLAAGKQIAGILGLADRIDWRAEGLGGIRLADRSVDAAYCIEVLEHVQRNPATVADLERLPRDLLIVTTPNLWFPAIAHDTRLPFCHWLPLPMRRVYARTFGRQNAENDNLFWSARSLEKHLSSWQPVARFLHYPSLGDYVATYPFHLPYVGGGYQRQVGSAKLAYYRLASLLGPASRYVMPNLAMVWKRKS